MVPLCGPCKSGQRGTANITHAQLRTIGRGGVRQRPHEKNAAGEIRGQVKATEIASDDSPPAPPPPPGADPPPNPYP